MIEAVWQGLLTGLILSTFTGPVLFAAIDLGLKGNIKGVAWLAFGTFISDSITVLLIYLLAQQSDRNSTFMQVMFIAGGAVLIFIGLRNVFSKKTGAGPENMNRESSWSLLAKGFLINSTNPNVFFFWFGAIMVAVQKYGNNNTYVLIHFFSALPVVFLTDFLKGYAAALLRVYIRNKNVLTWLGRISGLILIFWGIKLILFH